MLFVYFNEGLFSERTYYFIEVENPSMDPKSGLEQALNAWGRIMDDHGIKRPCGRVVLVTDTAGWREPRHRCTLADFFDAYAWKYEDDLIKALEALPSSVLLVIAERCTNSNLSTDARKILSSRFFK